ncbi:MAG: collagen-like protein [Candidatus Magasanikbacteria bacterium]|nr:collagen-like protein [Candidatus Magasanikbacteria bacterium]
MRWPVRGNLVSSLFFPISIWAGVLIFTGFLFFWNIAPVSAFDSLITYQGKLLNSSGNTVSDGTYYFKYTIYDASSGGTCKYTAAGSCTTPTSTAVTVSGGIFSTNFGAGSLNGFDSQIFGSGSLYLGVTVCTGPGSGCDSEMSPRKQIGAAPYAYNADRLSITTSTAGATAIAPLSNNTYDLGTTSTALKWRYGNFGTAILVGSGTVTSTLDISSLTFAGSATSTIVGVPGADAAGNAAIVLRSNVAISGADLIRIVEGSDPSTNIRFIIDNAGNVGVSSSTPGRTLDVGGSFMVAGNTILGDSASADTLTINAATSLFGNFNPGTNNTYDLGNTSTPLKWRYGSFGTAVLVGNGTATSTVNPNTVVVWDSTFVGTPSTTLSGGGLSIASQGGASISASGQNLDGTDIDLALSATRNVLIGGYGLAVSSSYGSAGVGLGVSDYFRSYGDNYLGDATTSDKTYFKSRIGDSLIPTANSILDLGEFGRAWRTLYASGTIRLGTAQGETIISSANGFYVSSTSVTVSSTATTTIAGKGSSDNVGNAAIILRGSDQANADILRVYTGLSAMSNPASLMVSANGYVGVTSGTPGARLAVSTGILGEVGMSVAGNSGADISQWYDSASAKAVYINSLGGLFASSTFQSTGATRLYSALTVDGATSLAVGTFSGNVTHGDATSSDVSYFNSRIGSSLIPTANNILDIGEPTRAWRDIYASGTLRVGSTLIIDSGTQTATGSFTLSASGFFTATSSATSTIVGQPGADAAGNAAVLIRSNGPVGTADLLRVAEGPDNISAVRFVIDNAGNVGISSSTPGRTLDVGGSFMVADNTILGDAATSDTVAVNARFLTALVPSTNGQLDLGIAATNYWRTGYFNIGVTVSDNQATSSLAASSLTFSGNSTGTILGAPVTDGAGNSALILRSSSAVSAADILRIQEATTVRFLIDNAGNVGINSSTPGRLLDVGGSFMVADNTILGDAESSDTIAVNARIIGNITPSANDTYDLGATSTNKKFRYGNFSGALSVSNGNSTSTFTTSTISYSNASSTLDIGFTEDTTTIDTAFRVSGPAGTGFDEIQRWNTGGTVRLTLVATSTSRVMFRSNITDSVGAEAYRFDTVQTITSTTAATALDRTLFTVANNGTNKFAISGGGNVYATAGFNANSTQFGIGDVAEYVNLAPGEGQYTEAGDVLMASTELSNKYLRANEAKTKAVAGVVTDTNAFTIGAPGADRVPLALAGFVSVKVTDEGGAVEPGDILVASSLPGHAMRYDPDKDDTSMVGVLGVALEKFVSGEGKIKALIKTGWVHSRSATLDTFSKNIVQIANATGISLDTKPKDQVTTASVKTAGGSVTLTGDTLDLLGGSIVNVKSVKSIDGIWEITADGRFVTKGTYGSVVDTSDGPTTLYAQQSPDVEFVLSGSAVLVNGASHVTFDTKAQQYIDPNVQIKVSVTMTSESPGVFVAEKTTSGFTVKEMNSGASSASFDWVAIVRRKGFGPPPALPSAQTSVEAPPVTTTADPSEPTASTDVTPVSVDTAPSETVITSPETVTATSSPDEATATTATDTIIDATTSTPVM